MEEYGYYKKKNRTRKQRTGGGVVIRIVDTVLFIITLVCTVCLLAAYLAPYIDPAKTTLFSFAGLVFPILYVAEIILGLYWLVRWRRIAIVVCVVLIFGIGGARKFYRPDIKRSYGEHKPLKTEVVVMTYNVMWMNDELAAGDKTISEMIGEFVIDNNVDILCMQEFYHSKRLAPFDSLLVDLKYRYNRSYSGDDTDKTMSGVGMGIYSRYPIIDRGYMQNDAGRMHSQWVDLKIKRDTVRVINNHLQSTYVSGSEVDFFSSFSFSSASKVKEKARDVAKKLSENYIRRSIEARRIDSLKIITPYPVIVCGDFNDTPVSYSYHKISRGLSDAFVKRGSGGTGTFNGGFFNMFRIDFIMASEGININNYYSYDVVMSDHMPVAAGIEVDVR